ncbi:hypothetical protein PTRG_11186 [Pyrenophora tritici-repentis Pt-1C-BFP]|uniref:Uncharacterized protein n=1 Tax=Pyrenophora tritici-repentis (strain Pt-1C-BFP) TaxID=426418 RepID=B2WMH6_PYRTR|nr:uncharacterized protein PTRG_11186 [Pyrenophora tritici-repentis Pt-1C-BFP]EDU44236.1 hypothetical protein PTRG_11186 [Pyrenophora tritici-repentis Pt-1C-BFP]
MTSPPSHKGKLAMPNLAVVVVLFANTLSFQSCTPSTRLQEVAGKSQAFSGNLDADRVERMTNVVSPNCLWPNCFPVWLKIHNTTKPCRVPSDPAPLPEPIVDPRNLKPF